MLLRPVVFPTEALQIVVIKLIIEFQLGGLKRQLSVPNSTPSAQPAQLFLTQAPIRSSPLLASLLPKLTAPDREPSPPLSPSRLPVRYSTAQSGDGSRDDRHSPANRRRPPGW